MIISLLLAGLASAVLTAESASPAPVFDPAFAGLTSDLKASNVGDTLTVLVYQTAEARNASSQSSRRNTQLNAGLGVDNRTDQVQARLNGGAAGQGELRRSESLVTQLTVRVEEVAANGDLIVSGRQLVMVNGEETELGLKGRVRPEDISPSNEVLSFRLADAEIRYEGEGFVTDAANPGPVTRLFRWLGLT